MIICSTLPFLKDAKGIFILVIMFNNSYIESVMKTIRLSRYMVLWTWQCTTFNQHFYHAFWSGYNENVPFISSFTFCQDFAPSESFQNNLQDRCLFKFSLSCFGFVFIYFFTICLFLCRNHSLTEVATLCMQTWTTKTGRFTEHALQRFTLTSLIPLRVRL